MRKLFSVGLVCVALTAAVSLSIQNGTKTVTTAGTAVPLAASSTAAAWVTVQALSTNTGIVCVGGSGVLAASKNATCLTSGLAAPMHAVAGVIYDLNAIYIDAAVNGEGVSFTYAR